jgi:flagellar M-ring protein FliF
MDFLNQAIEQVRELFLSMTPAARLTAGLLAAVIGVSLGFLFQRQTSGPNEYLFGGVMLSPHDANRVELAIAQAGLSGWEREGNRIRVPRGNKAEYLAAVESAGVMPRDVNNIMPDVYKETSPFDSNRTQQGREKAANEQRLSMLVSARDGIESAKVIYDITRTGGLRQRSKGTASVMVRPEPNQPLQGRQIKEIKQMVASAIADLSMADVNVTDESNGSYYGNMGAEVTADLFDDPYYVTRLRYEQWVESKIANLISYIPNVRIMVTAELDDTKSLRSRKVTPEGEPVPLRDKNREEETSSTRKENGGRPGPEAQGPSRTGAEPELAIDESTSNNLDKETENYIGSNEEILEQAGLTPKRVRASIAIPSSYLESIWRENNQDQPEDAKPEATALMALENAVKEKIQKAIMPLLPRLEPGKDPFEQIELTVFQSFTTPPVEQPSMASHASAWLGQNTNNLIMGGLALASLVMLRSAVKSISPSGPAPALASPALSIHQTEENPLDQASGAGAEEEQRPRPRLKLKKGASLKDDLADIVNENPEAAASILRGWIDNAA